MEKIEIPAIEPLPHRAIFKRHEVKPAQVAQILGYSFSHVTNILNGYVPAKPEIREKLDALVDQLEGRGA